MWKVKEMVKMNLKKLSLSNPCTLKWRNSLITVKAPLYGLRLRTKDWKRLWEPIIFRVNLASFFTDMGINENAVEEQVEILEIYQNNYSQ